MHVRVPPHIASKACLGSFIIKKKHLSKGKGKKEKEKKSKDKHCDANPNTKNVNTKRTMRTKCSNHVI